jgi:hypothetical protein
MSARTLSEINLAQEAMIETLVAELRAERKEAASLRGLLAEWIARPQRSAVETVELTRGTTGDHATGVKVTAVSQNGETLAEVEARAAAVFEARAARYPLPSGVAHAAALGPDDLEERLRATLAQWPSRESCWGEDGS